MRVYVDIETFSSVDLTKTGVYRYAESPDFQILMAAWKDDDSSFVDLDEDSIRARLLAYMDDPDVIFVAFNAQFERICFSRLLGMPPGVYLAAERWHDPQAVGANYGFPQRLAMIAPALGAEKKDEAGTRLINIFSKPNRKGVRTLPAEKPLEWLDFIDYCEQDVVSLADVDTKLEAMGGWPTHMEHQIYLADQRCSDLGMKIDVRMARKAVVAVGENKARQTFQMLELMDWAILNPASNVQMMEWMQDQGLDAKNLQKETVQDLLDGELTPAQRGVFELRQELALVAFKKYASALLSVSPDGRLRGTLKYFGAHTGRWAGRGTQVHNLPRQQIPLPPEDVAELGMMRDLGLPKEQVDAREIELREARVEEAIRALIKGLGADSPTLKALVRALFIGPLTVFDYAAIEARIIAWLAGEEWALKAFREGRDIYVETADRMSTPDRPLDRSQGKVAVLALGYNGAVNSLRAMGAEGDDEELAALVKQWRRANPRIVRFWQQLGDAFGEGGKVGKYINVRISSDALGRSVYIDLPSGRSIGYHGTKWEHYKVKHSTIPGKMISKEGWRYADPKNPFNRNQRIGTYGGRLAENITQAVARDIMAEAIVRLHGRGYDVVGHVHDEVLIDGEHDVDQLCKIASEVPDWATDLPIDAEGFVCQRYRKG